MNQENNQKNLIAQIEVDPNLPEQTNLPNVPGDAGINGLTCFVLALSVFYSLLKK